MADYANFENVVNLWDNAISTALSTINPTARTINTDNLAPAYRQMFEQAYGAAAGDVDFANRFFDGFTEKTKTALNYMAKDPINGAGLLAQSARSEGDDIIRVYSGLIDAATIPANVSDRVNEAARRGESIRIEDIIRSLR